jgi:hypothetical protein
MPRRFRPVGLWQVTIGRMCAGVEATSGCIIRTAPILAKFRGQPLCNLQRWAGRRGGTVVKVADLPDEGAADANTT